MNTNVHVKTAFVTGGTGLLGNNLVRELIKRGFNVKALVRSRTKGEQQFGDLIGVELVVGDMGNVAAFAAALRGSDVVFHTAAYFRDHYKGGNHWNELKRINVDGTEKLIQHAYFAGVRRFIHTSSVAVLHGAPGSLIDETQLRAVNDGDDYFRSKILADEVVLSFLEKHEDMHASLVLPGAMWGPADIGPTSAGQLVIDVALGKLPGLAPGSFPVVDARDVALAQIAAAEYGRRGERYIAAGRHMTMRELIPLLGQAAGVATPTRTLPFPVLLVFAAIQELYTRISGKPIMLSWATVKVMIKESDRSRFNHAKSKRELGLEFRPIEETLKDTVDWYRNHGWLPAV